MFESTKQIRVRYGETDRMGFVYYGNYTLYYEEARTDAMRKIGLSYKELEEQGIMLPVVNLHARFMRPAGYDEMLTVKTQLRELPNRKMKFHCEIFNEEGVLLNFSEVTLMFIKRDSMKACQPPTSLLEKLSPYFETATN